MLAYAATEGATAAFTPGNETDYQPQTPQVAGFSSHGPVAADGSDIVKPDVSAPGVGILGLLSYGDTGAVTALEVVTQEDVLPGTPVSTVLPSITATFPSSCTSPPPILR